MIARGNFKVEPAVVEQPDILMTKDDVAAAGGGKDRVQPAIRGNLLGAGIVDDEIFAVVTGETAGFERSAHDGVLLGVCNEAADQRTRYRSRDRLLHR